MGHIVPTPEEVELAMRNVRTDSLAIICPECGRAWHNSHAHTCGVPFAEAMGGDTSYLIGTYIGSNGEVLA